MGFLDRQIKDRINKIRFHPTLPFVLCQSGEAIEVFGIYSEEKTQKKKKKRRKNFEN